MAPHESRENIELGEILPKSPKDDKKFKRLKFKTSVEDKHTGFAYRADSFNPGSSVRLSDLDILNERREDHDMTLVYYAASNGTESCVLKSYKYVDGSSVWTSKINYGSELTLTDLPKITVGNKKVGDSSESGAGSIEPEINVSELIIFNRAKEGSEEGSSVSEAGVGGSSQVEGGSSFDDLLKLSPRESSHFQSEQIGSSQSGVVRSYRSRDNRASVDVDVLDKINAWRSSVNISYVEFDTRDGRRYSLAQEGIRWRLTSYIAHNSSGNINCLLVGQLPKIRQQRKMNYSMESPYQKVDEVIFFQDEETEVVSQIRVNEVESVLQLQQQLPPAYGYGTGGY